MGRAPDCVEEGKYIAIEVDVLNRGVLAEASGEAEWKMNASRVRFSVEIEVLRGIGDAGRVRRWLETGDPGSIAVAARNYERERTAAYRVDSVSQNGSVQ